MVGVEEGEERDILGEGGQSSFLQKLVRCQQRDK